MFKIKLRKHIQKISIIKRVIIASIAFFVGFSLVFVSGIFNDETKIEHVAEYFSNLAISDSRDGLYSYFSVTPKDDFELKSAGQEFAYLKHVFKESTPNFIGTVNSNKSESIICEEIDSSKNFSFLYLDSGFTNISQDDQVWLQEFYRFPVMFQGDHHLTDEYSFCYISKSHADSILAVKGIESPTHSDYLSLIGDSLFLNINGEILKWKIANIYYEDNAFVDVVSSVIGDFFLGYKKFPQSIKKEATFITRQYQYQNRFLLKYAKDNYPMNNYEYKVGENNLKNNIKVDNSIFVDLFQKNNLNFLSFILLAFSAFILISSTFFVYLFINVRRKRYFLGFCCIPACVFLIFYFVYFLTREVLIFSQFSVISFAIFFILYVALIYFIFSKLFFDRRKVLYA